MSDDCNGESRKDSPPDGSDPLVVRLVAGDRRVLEEVRARITRVVRARAHYIPRQEQSDVVQAAMLRVWRAVTAEGFACQSLEGFASTVAHRCCVDWLRRNRTAAPLPAGGESDAPGPERQLLDEERVDLAQRVIAALAPGCRELLRLQVVEGLGPGEIARRQARSEGSVRTQTWKCLRRARQLLDLAREAEPARDGATMEAGQGRREKDVRGSAS